MVALKSMQELESGITQRSEQNIRVAIFFSLILAIVLAFKVVIFTFIAKNQVLFVLSLPTLLIAASLYFKPYLRAIPHSYLQLRQLLRTSKHHRLVLRLSMVSLPPTRVIRLLSCSSNFLLSSFDPS